MQLVGTKPPATVTSRARRRADASYRNFRLVVGQRGTTFAGVAYAGKIATFHAEAASLDAVESGLQNQIDGDLNARIAAATENGWTKEDYLLALFLISSSLSPVQTHVISRIAETAGDPLTLEQLRWPSVFSEDAVQRGLTRLSKMLSHAMHGAQEKRPVEDGLENFVEGDAIQPWTFRPNVVAAADEFTEAVH